MTGASLLGDRSVAQYSIPTGTPTFDTATACYGASVFDSCANLHDAGQGGATVISIHHRQGVIRVGGSVVAQSSVCSLPPAHNSACIGYGTSVLASGRNLHNAGESAAAANRHHVHSMIRVGGGIIAQPSTASIPPAYNPTPTGYGTGV